MKDTLNTPAGPVPAFPPEKRRVEAMSDQELMDSLNNSAFVDPHELAEAQSRDTIIYEHPGRGWMSFQEYKDNPPQRGFSGLMDAIIENDE